MDPGMEDTPTESSSSIPPTGEPSEDDASRAGLGTPSGQQAFETDIQTALRINPSISISLLKQEQKYRANVEKHKNQHREISEEVKSKFSQLHAQYTRLKETERSFSEQAGRLLNSLQVEEAVATKLSATLKKIKHMRKKLLARISNPRWEIKHHYHMTCLEHVMGHAQPHVMEVGEMVPGHLRLFCFSRRSTLFQKGNGAKEEHVHKMFYTVSELAIGLVSALTRAKAARSAFSDQIKVVYGRLRQTRAELREVEKILHTMKGKSHLITTESQSGGPSEQKRQQRMEPSRGGRFRGGGGGRFGGPGGGSAQAMRMRYLKSLNEQPVKMDEEWKKVMGLLKNLEVHAETSTKANEELQFLEDCRSRFGIGVESLPAPLKLGCTPEDSDEKDDLLDLTMTPGSIPQILPAELGSSPIQSFSPLSSSPSEYLPSPTTPRQVPTSLEAAAALSVPSSTTPSMIVSSHASSSSSPVGNSQLISKQSVRKKVFGTPAGLQKHEEPNANMKESSRGMTSSSKLSSRAMVRDVEGVSSQDIVLLDAAAESEQSSESAVARRQARRSIVNVASAEIRDLQEAVLAKTEVMRKKSNPQLIPQPAAARKGFRKKR